MESLLKILGTNTRKMTHQIITRQTIIAVINNLCNKNQLIKIKRNPDRMIDQG